VIAGVGVPDQKRRWVRKADSTKEVAVRPGRALTGTRIINSKLELLLAATEGKIVDYVELSLKIIDVLSDYEIRVSSLTQ
jgi:hypothetical protein